MTVMSVTESIYRGALRGARALLAPTLARGDSKLARGLRGRRGAVSRMVDWAREARDLDRPLVWVHAPSVGEGLQARAVVERLRAHEPALQTAFTFFSPSAERWARGLDVDVCGYLPWDLPAELDLVLDALRPDVVVFTKTEVWPTLTDRCARRDVPAALIAGTLPRGSSRRRPLARTFLGPAYARLAAVLAVSDEDAEALGRLGAPTSAIAVTGDPGIDAAAERAASADRRAAYLAPFHAHPVRTLVAGSTWPADEAVLLPAVARQRQRTPELRLVVAPHEPDERHVPPLVEALRRDRWPVTTLSEVERTGDALAPGAAVVVDRVGVLSHLYTVGTVAFVGGGFGTDGLHSVLEPAAAGVPVLFGPRHANARDAARLVGVGAARAVPGADALAEALEVWLADAGALASAGSAAARYIDAHRGAAERSATALLHLLDRRPSPT